MKNLNPTLWRTCRMLSGSTRIRLLRALHDQPGLNVTEYARALNIGRSDASQELRRIQSRGLLQSEHCGVSVIYRLGTDPQVASAAPLLKALKSTLDSFPPDQDADICVMAHAFAHPKRIAILKSLSNAPQTTDVLQKEVRTSFSNLHRHLQAILASGLARRDAGALRLVSTTHPLAKTLFKLLPP